MTFTLLSKANYEPEYEIKQQQKIYKLWKKKEIYNCIYIFKSDNVYYLITCNETEHFNLKYLKLNLYFPNVWKEEKSHNICSQYNVNFINRGFLKK